MGLLSTSKQIIDQGSYCCKFVNLHPFSLYEIIIIIQTFVDSVLSVVKVLSKEPDGDAWFVKISAFAQTV